MWLQAAYSNVKSNRNNNQEIKNQLQSSDFTLLFSNSRPFRIPNFHKAPVRVNRKLEISTLMTSRGYVIWVNRGKPSTEQQSPFNNRSTPSTFSSDLCQCYVTLNQYGLCINVNIPLIFKLSIIASLCILGCNFSLPP